MTDVKFVSSNFQACHFFLFFFFFFFSEILISVRPMPKVYVSYIPSVHMYKDPSDDRAGPRHVQASTYATSFLVNPDIWGKENLNPLWLYGVDSVGSISISILLPFLNAQGLRLQALGLRLRRPRSFCRKGTLPIHKVLLLASISALLIPSVQTTSNNTVSLRHFMTAPSWLLIPSALTTSLRVLGYPEGINSQAQKKFSVPPSSRPLLNNNY